MERTEHEITLAGMLPKLEVEHDAEPNEEYRELIWKLIGAVEVYLLMRDEKRRKEA